MKLPSLNLVLQILVVVYLGMWSGFMLWCAYMLYPHPEVQLDISAWIVAFVLGWMPVKIFIFTYIAFVMKIPKPKGDTE